MARKLKVEKTVTLAEADTQAVIDSGVYAEGEQPADIQQELVDQGEAEWVESDAQQPESTPDVQAKMVIDVLANRPDPVRRLRVNRIFQGARTGEQAILDGLYYEDDPALFGLAEWLVNNQYAEWAA